MPSMATGVPALVFKTTRFPLYHGTLGVIRSLGEAGVPVYAALDDAFAPAGLSRHLAGKFLWTPDQADVGGILDGLAEIARRIGRPCVLIPTDDHSAIVINENAKALAQHFLFPRAPMGLTRLLCNKERLHDVCTVLGVPSPKTAFPNSAAEAEALAAEFEFPVLVKIREPWRRPRAAGLMSTMLVHDMAELRRLFLIAERSGTDSLLLQERIPAERDAMLAAYFAERGQCRFALTGEKLRSYPAFAGMTSSGRTEVIPDLAVLAERLALGLGYAGIVDLEFRQDARDGSYKLLDFNPRLGAQFRLYETADGVDVVRAMHLDLCGREMPVATTAQDRLLVVENYEIRTFWDYHRAGALSLGQWLRSLSGKRELAWFRWSDPLPALVLWTRFLGAWAGKRIRQAFSASSPAPASTALHEVRPGLIGAIAAMVRPREAGRRQRRRAAASLQ